MGGGYHRYAVDPAWAVPHFEKMLYDQAQIALNALEMKQASGDERYAWMARDIFAYVAERLTGTAGDFSRRRMRTRWWMLLGGTPLPPRRKVRFMVGTRRRSWRCWAETRSFWRALRGEGGGQCPGGD